MISNVIMIHDHAMIKPGRGRRPINPDRMFLGLATLTVASVETPVYLVSTLVFVDGAYCSVNDELFENEAAAEVVFNVRLASENPTARVAVADAEVSPVAPELVIDVELENEVFAGDVLITEADLVEVEPVPELAV